MAARELLPWQGPEDLLPEEVESPAPPMGLHAAQQAIFDDLARISVVAAGRRFGKSYFAVKLACWWLRHSHNQHGDSLKNAPIWYVSPTLDLGLEQIEPLILEELGEECVKHHKVKNFFEHENGRRLYLKSAWGKGDTLRGRGIGGLIADEISQFPPGIWETVLRPMLIDYQSPALLIGTPIGRGKLFELFEFAEKGEHPDWKAWKFKTVDNPHILASEVESATRSMTESQAKQEFFADWDTGGGNIFNPKALRNGTFKRGVHQLAVVFGSDQPFTDAHAVSGTESALIVALMHPLGWHVVSAQRGFWSVSDTIRRIANAWDEYCPRYLALSSKDKKFSENLIQEYQRHHDFRTAVRFFEVVDADDIDRVKWALQSRLIKGRISAGKGRGRQQLMAQLQDFPIEYANGELVQALSYLDQLPNVNFGHRARTLFRPLDALAGY